MKTHFTWSIEKNDSCPLCGSAPVLITSAAWEVDYEDVGEGEDSTVEVYEEVSGHYCLKCKVLISLSLNT